MFNTGNCSVPLVASIDGNGNNGNGFGDGGWAWWIIILLIFGWGGNGFGFGGNGGANSPGLQGLATRADINEGFALNNLQSGINALQQGICDSTYALNNAITNGFNNTNMGMMQGFNGVERGFCNLSAQLAQCCCDNREAISQVRYDIATQACDTRNVIQNSTKDIIEGQNAGTRAILDFFNTGQDCIISGWKNQSPVPGFSDSSECLHQANQDAQMAELIRRLGADCPQPAYVVQPPQPVTFSNYNSCGCLDARN